MGTSTNNSFSEFMGGAKTQAIPANTQYRISPDLGRVYVATITGSGNAIIRLPNAITHGIHNGAPVFYVVIPSSVTGSIIIMDAATRVPLIASGGSMVVVMLLDRNDEGGRWYAKLMQLNPAASGTTKTPPSTVLTSSPSATSTPPPQSRSSATYITTNRTDSAGSSDSLTFGASAGSTTAALSEFTTMFGPSA